MKTLGTWTHNDGSEDLCEVTTPDLTTCDVVAPSVSVCTVTTPDLPSCPIIVPVEPCITPVVVPDTVTTYE